MEDLCIYCATPILKGHGVSYVDDGARMYLHNDCIVRHVRGRHPWNKVSPDHSQLVAENILEALMGTGQESGRAKYQVQFI